MAQAQQRGCSTGGHIATRERERVDAPWRRGWRATTSSRTHVKPPAGAPYMARTSLVDRVRTVRMFEEPWSYATGCHLQANFGAKHVHTQCCAAGRGAPSAAASTSVSTSHPSCRGGGRPTLTVQSALTTSSTRRAALHSRRPRMDTMRCATTRSGLLVEPEPCSPTHVIDDQRQAQWARPKADALESLKPARARP